jgi:tetratricopeptide (TPR) repeat protein
MADTPNRPMAEPPSIIAKSNDVTDSEPAPTTYQTQLASFLSLCRPAKTAYGDDPCGNLQPRPFGGLGVIPRKAPEWVAMYDSLSQTIPAVRVKNPKFSAPVPNTPAPGAAAAPGNSVPVRSSSTTAREKFDHGVSLASADNLDGALADFSEAIRLDPKFSDAYVQRGQAMFKNGNADRAISDFTQALQIDPRNAGAFKARGMAMLYKGDDDGAIIDLTKAIQYAEIDPASIPAVEVFYARRSRASLYDRKQLYDRELIDLNAMIDSYWKNPGLATTLKTTYRDQGAATLLASIYRLRAAVNQKRSNLDNAIGDLSFAIQLDPQRALPFIIERARFLEAAGRKDQAAADYQQALNLSPANIDVKNELERLRGSSK